MLLQTLLLMELLIIKPSVNTTDSNGQTFNVKVTPSDATDTNVAGKSLTLEVKAELVK